MMDATGGRAWTRRGAIVASAFAATTGSLLAKDESGTFRAGAQDNAVPEIQPRPEDVGSMEALIKALYDTISGPIGPRDWDRLRSLFIPGARLIPCGRGRDGSINARVLSVEDFIKAVELHTKTEGFFESEIHRRVERFGAVAHVFSTYESRHARDEKPFVRGINSFQLFFDGQRWWVVTIFWDSERPDQPIPAEYLPARS